MLGVPINIIAGTALISSILLLVLSGFMGGLDNEAAAIGAKIFVFLHLYPTNLIASYIAGRSLYKHSPESTYKSVLILLLVQVVILLILVGFYPLLALLCFCLLFLGKKHQQKVGAV